MPTTCDWRPWFLLIRLPKTDKFEKDRNSHFNLTTERYAIDTSSIGNRLDRAEVGTPKTSLMALEMDLHHLADLDRSLQPNTYKAGQNSQIQY